MVVRPNSTIWHVSSSSGEACCELLYPVTLLYFTTQVAIRALRALYKRTFTHSVATVDVSTGIDSYRTPWHVTPSTFDNLIILLHFRAVQSLTATPCGCLSKHNYLLTVLLWPPYIIGQTIIFLPCGFFLLSSIFFPRLISAAADWMSTILPQMVWP